MPVGGGRYDSECEGLVHMLNAQGVILCVLGGVKGNGFSLAFEEISSLRAVPNLLRQMADSVELDLANGQLDMYKYQENQARKRQEGDK